jgi:hypothetical protein
MSDVTPSDIIVIEGDEQSRFVPGTPDGGLPLLFGVDSRCVFRATRGKPEISDGRGWTYHHHVDMACWKGKLYVGWNTCEKDEDVWPSRELFAVADDGFTWSEPRELFPQEISTPLRIYFYHAKSTGRMLAIAGLRVDTADTDEDRKSGLVVREIHADHALGEVFTLRSAGSTKEPTLFTASRDAGFVASCRELLANRVYLEQQDRGRLLDDDARMIWHRAEAWPGGTVPGDDAKWVCGKAYSFITRPDGLTVGISKMGWTTSTRDAGQTWSRPVVPPTLVTGKAKVWAQRTNDGRFALAYNPSAKQRFPLAVVHGEDGQHFRGMRVVHADLPCQRYPGLHRSVGPQYIRGISSFSDDGSRAGEQAMWLVYSINKEDIWVSRVALPIGESTAPNTYVPKWSSVEFLQGGLTRIVDRDPFDHVTIAWPTTARRIRVPVLLDAVAPRAIELQLRSDDSPEPLASLSLERLPFDKLTEIELAYEGLLRPSYVLLRTGPRATALNCLNIDAARDVPWEQAELTVGAIEARL